MAKRLALNVIGNNDSLNLLALKLYAGRNQILFYSRNFSPTQYLLAKRVDQNNTLKYLHLRKMAESEGFEPSVHLTTDTCLAGKPIRPLWQLSETYHYNYNPMLVALCSYKSIEYLTLSLSDNTPNGVNLLHQSSYFL